MTATCVMVEGPDSELNHDFDEIPVWYVFAADDDGEEVGKVYRFRSFDAAVDLGVKMARDRRLELVNDARRA